MCDEGCPTGAVAFRGNDGVAQFRHLRADLFREVFMEVLNPGEIDMGIVNVPGAKENRSRATEFIVLGSVAVANFQQAIVDELLKTHYSPFTRHIHISMVQFDAFFLLDVA